MGFYADRAGVLTIGILFPVLCTVSVALRFAARKYKKLQHGAEHLMAVLALAFTLGCGAIMIAGAVTGTVGTTSVPLSNSKSHLQGWFQYSFLVVQVFAIAFIRLTFIYLYLRVFARTIWYKLSLVLVGITVAWTITFFLAMLLQCGAHITAIGAPYPEYVKYCSRSPELATGMAITDAVFDLIILLFPIYPVMRLNMTTQAKLQVLGLFSLCTFSVIVSFIKMVIFVDLSHAPTGVPHYLFGLDTETETALSGIIAVTLWWNYMQVGVACWASNLPPIVGIVAKMAWEPIRTLTSHIPLLSLPRRGSGSAASKKSKNSADNKQAADTVQEQGYDGHSTDEPQSTYSEV